MIASSQDKASAGVAQAGERLVVHAFARYRTTDPLKFYRATADDNAAYIASLKKQTAALVGHAFYASPGMNDLVR